MCLYTDNQTLVISLFDKRDDLNFPLVNFPVLSISLPSEPIYGINIYLKRTYIFINLFHRNMAGILYKANDAYLSRAADRTFVLGPILVYLKYSGTINVYMTLGLGLLLL